MTDIPMLINLHVHENQFETIPEVLFHLKEIRRLVIGLNPLASYVLSKKLDNWKRLRHLTLKDMRLHLLPDTFENLTQLIWLNLSKNQFVQFPSPILALGQLKKLFLGHNQLMGIPPQINRLEQLEHIDLSYNQIEDLVRVNASRNQITFIEDAHLENSKVEGQNIKGQNLGEFILVNNPLNVRPKTLALFKQAKWKAKKVREYLEDEQYHGKEEFRHVRLVILGDTKSGRSSWGRTLFEGEIEFGENWTLVIQHLSMKMWNKCQRHIFLCGNQAFWIYGILPIIYTQILPLLIWYLLMRFIKFLNTQL